MSITFFLKNYLNNMPIGLDVGKHISKLPYAYRPGIGSSYSTAQKDIIAFQKEPKKNEKFIFDKVKKLVLFAYENTRFYKVYYDQQKFDPFTLNSFEDLVRIPITSKKIFQNFSLEERSSSISGLSKSNTGGSTGTPLTFYTTSFALGNEWAHLHKIWNALGFKPSDLKINFVGRSNVKNGLQYDLIRHSLNIDIYKDFSDIEEKLLKVIGKNKVRFLHGYPTAIYEFACYCEKENSELKEILNNSLKGVFLNSEYPYKKFREKIENVFGVPTQSFYGHTERCIMGYETAENFNFEVLQTYGFAEVIDHSLIGTSYYSFGTPLIRYNTDDLVDSYENKGALLNSFKLKEGRKGDFVLDKNEKKIPLTGLIFGRHHKLFDYCEYLQVSQEEKGLVIVYYTTQKDIMPIQASALFDSGNVSIDFEFIKLQKPIRTAAGKISLRVKSPQQ